MRIPSFLDEVMAKVDSWQQKFTGANGLINGLASPDSEDEIDEVCW